MPDYSLGHADPAGTVEHEPNPFRMMPQDQAQKPAGSDDFLVGHLILSF